MFFSKARIAQSIAQLQDLDLFFGTTFLALKEVALPVGTTITISLTATLEAFLLDWLLPYLRGKYPIDFLEEKAPFLAKELKRQCLDDMAQPMWQVFLKGRKTS